MSVRRPILYALGILLSVLTPAAATLSYFPLWTARGATYALSGGCVLLLVISLVPLLRWTKERWKNPSAPMLWGVLFLLFFALSRIADEMCVISFFGLIGNALGSLCFRLAKEKRNADD